MINNYSILNGTKYVSSDGIQNYLVFISTRSIYWISKNSNQSKDELPGSIGMSQWSIKSPHTSDINFALKLIDDYQF